MVTGETEEKAAMKRSLSSPLSLSLFLSLSLLLPCPEAQQDYIANKQLNCYTNSSSTLGYTCNGAQTSCSSYLIFRSQPPYQTPVQIGYLLASEPSEIAQINGVTDVDTIPTSTLVIVPVNCSCPGNKNDYQHNTSYTLKYTGETYLLVANDTYQGLSTCQALIGQNPYDSTNLTVNLKVRVPLRCACPTRNQTGSGVKYLLTYSIIFGDTVEAVAERFGVSPQSVLDANRLSSATTIFPFTTLLIPLKSEPTKAQTVTPPSASPASPVVPAEGGGSDDNTWVYAGIGIGVGFLVISLLLAWFVHRRWRRRRRSNKSRQQPFPEEGNKKKLPESGEYGGLSETTASTFSGEVRGVLESLTLYKFEELERATGYFGEDHRISGSVYRGVIGGDEAAIKRRKGDVSGEITILKQINHSSVIRLSGFCLHEGNSYLVYEFAENGSLSDWIHHGAKKWSESSSSRLGWKQRVRIACDVADGMNYLHNYTKPPYVHKDLKSSNILLDGEFRAKVGNFGLARSVENTQGGLQLTRHVVGTQGYMAPEYLEHGLVTPKLDVFAFGVLLLELLSGKEAAKGGDGEGGPLLLSARIGGVLGGENVRDKLRRFVDPCLRDEYPFDLVFAMSQLAMRCVDQDPSSRPSMAEVFASLSAIYSSSLDWDPSSEIPHSGSTIDAR